MTTYRKTKRAFLIQHVSQNLGHDVHSDNRILTKKANDDAIMAVRGKINNLLTVKDSFDFIAALNAVENKWIVINNEKYHTVALLVAAIDKASHTKISRFNTQKAAMAAEAAGWAVAWSKYNTRITGVAWIGQHLATSKS